MWDSFISTDSEYLELIQRKFVALCYNRFLSPDIHGYSFTNVIQICRT
jgi:hypothetical protein